LLGNFYKTFWGEIDRLGNVVLREKIKVCDREKCFGDFDLEVRVGELVGGLADLKTEPEGVYFDEVERYEVVLSEEGYEMLREGSSTEIGLDWEVRLVLVWMG